MCSSVFWVICSFFFWAIERFACKKEQIAAIALLKWATLANHSWSLFCSEQLEQLAQSCSVKKSNWAKSDKSNLLFGIKREKNCKKNRVWNLLISFEWFTRENEQIAAVALLSLATWANRPELPFCKEQQEQIVYGRSFVQSDLSNLGTVAV